MTCTETSNELLSLVNKLNVKDYMLGTSQAWNREKQVESLKSFELMTSQILVRRFKFFATE